MRVSSTEFRRDLNHYYDVAQKEDVYVTRNGKDVIVVSGTVSKKYADAEKVFGCLPPWSDEEVEKMMEERLKEL